jgi:hypothetical protein
MFLRYEDLSAVDLDNVTVVPPPSDFKMRRTKDIKL